jgi:lipopolysaccharide export LptBFGC system permease protein LptF
MFSGKLNLIAPFALAALGIIFTAIEPALAGVGVPAPIVGAGLPAIAVLAGGYWLVKKLRERR